jgi:hypothetical protein
VLEIDFRAGKFCSSLHGISTHTIETLQHHSLYNILKIAELD